MATLSSADNLYKQFGFIPGPTYLTQMEIHFLLFITLASWGRTFCFKLVCALVCSLTSKYIHLLYFLINPKNLGGGGHVVGNAWIKWAFIGYIYLCILMGFGVQFVLSL